MKDTYDINGTTYEITRDYGEGETLGALLVRYLLERLG